MEPLRAWPCGMSLGPRGGGGMPSKGTVGPSPFPFCSLAHGKQCVPSLAIQRSTGSLPPSHGSEHAATKQFFAKTIKPPLFCKLTSSVPLLQSPKTSSRASREPCQLSYPKEINARSTVLHLVSSAPPCEVVASLSNALSLRLARAA